ncbi:hypothetical protein [Lentzea flaviverrucosa]|uniref:Uncharacterized protein n=1 Tax=Lentzea flaviverrucosa TaxID=200379 RepID=A0A1H9QT81_9PSEU|nr:hypothetical protein [Lentzea flaviverrucosa]RDI32765.1 hypothetical protein DFR72_10211 [Lentzea flaviverrucosa]SER63658.1 hypothetical protein SAMN05216195_10612 [Lentzea flaviverrucosa]
MKLEGERWRTLVSTVRLGRDEYRVVQPARPLRHAPLYEGYMGVETCVTKTSALDIAMAWAFAMRSPRTLVYLPLRQSDCECRSADGPALDMVLLHHSLGFRLSKWRDVRARLRGGRSHTVVCQGMPQERALPRWEQGVLRGEIAESTVFIVGDRSSFQAGGQAFRQLVEDCPRHMHEVPGTHCCAELTPKDRYWNWLHVVYCDEHRVSTRR